MDLSRIPYVPSPFFTQARGRSIDLIVIHDMEAPEKGDTAENVARYFQSPGLGVSSHYCLDDDSIVQCVPLDYVAWCAPGANHNGIHLEHAGYARQTRDQWLDSYSMEMLDLSAQLTSVLCKKYGIPVAFVGGPGIRAGKRGITTHAAVTDAYPDRGSHWDPGPGFPMDVYLDLVKKYSAPKAPVDPGTGWPTPIPKWFWKWAAWRLGGRKGARPKTAPLVIPPWAWRRLLALQKGRDK